MRRLMFGAAGTLLWLFISVTPATAGVDGQCTATINGIAVDRIDSIQSPLELGDTDVLILSGTDDLGTEMASVEIVLASLTIDTSAATYGSAQHEFSVSLPLNEPSAYSIGLLHVRATTDNCAVDAWVRVSGRLPFMTLAGLIGAAVGFAGLFVQVRSLVSQPSWFVYGSSVAGIATGAGFALVGQQFGRLQLSYPSLLTCALAASLAGLVIATYLILRERPRYRGAPRAPRVAAPLPEPSLEPAPIEAFEPELDIAEALESQARAAEAGTAAASGLPYWGYVMADIDVLHLDDYSEIVATLQPGTWYLIKREVAGWAHVVASDQAEGWVPGKAIHPHETE
jgi:hypothetical protein